MKTYEKQISTFFKQPWIMLIVVILLSHLIALVSQLPFNIGGTKVDYSASDLMSLSGSIIGSFATLFLGMIAYNQNIKLHRINTKLIELQNQVLVPIVEVSKHKIEKHRPKELQDYDPNNLVEVNQVVTTKPTRTLFTCKIDLRVAFEINVDETVINFSIKNITNNIIKKISLLEIRTNVFEVDDSSTKRKITIPSDYENKCSEEFIKENDEIPLELRILTSGEENRVNSYIKNDNYIEIDLLIESLRDKYVETICIRTLDDMFKVTYKF
ncbi:MAG: hypothetical protein N4A74_14120 [Carboxylicivirga sp.]|nr:hypothetical protein [Carboxylicivirga sp.]